MHKFLFWVWFLWRVLHPVILKSRSLPLLPLDCALGYEGRFHACIFFQTEVVWWSRAHSHQTVVWSALGVHIHSPRGIFFSSKPWINSANPKAPKSGNNPKCESAIIYSQISAKLLCDNVYSSNTINKTEMGWNELEQEQTLPKVLPCKAVISASNQSTGAVATRMLFQRFPRSGEFWSEKPWIQVLSCLMHTSRLHGGNDTVFLRSMKNKKCIQIHIIKTTRFAVLQKAT